MSTQTGRSAHPPSQHLNTSFARIYAFGPSLNTGRIFMSHAVCPKSDSSGAAHAFKLASAQLDCGLNYLGHMLALPGEGLVTLGNLLGDFIKGRAETIHPLDFRLGVRLHRELDGFTDAHPAVKHSKSLIPVERRRVAGILIDIFYDHFFVEGVDFAWHRKCLEPFVHQLPEDIRGLPQQMLSSRWFGAYSRIDGIGQILAKMDQRRERALGLLGGECYLEDHYESLRTDAREFFPEMQAFTKEAILRLRSAYPEEAPSAAAAEAVSDPQKTS